MMPDGTSRDLVPQLKASYYGALCSFSGSKNELSPAGVRGAAQQSPAPALCSPNAPAPRGWAEPEHRAVVNAELKTSPFKWWGYISELECQFQNFLRTYLNFFYSLLSLEQKPHIINLFFFFLFYCMSVNTPV